MPANAHLQWNEVTDFTPGLWTATDWLMPANAAQEMQDCYPQPGGGLRAFYRRQMASGTSSPNLTGLSPNTEVYLGCYAHPSGGINPISDRYLIAWDTASRIPKLYFSTGAGWTKILKQPANTDFAATASNPVLRQSFITTYLVGPDVGPWTRKVVFNLNVGSADDGIWIMTRGGVTGGSGAGTGPTKMVVGGTAPSGPIVVHQSRLVVSDGSVIRWSEVGSETFNNKFLLTEPSGLRPATTFLVAYSPSDLLIGKEAGPLVLVQGDLSSPTVRAMDETVQIAAAQVPGKAPMGLCFVAHRDGVYSTQGGSGTDKISKQLSPDNFSLPVVFGAFTPSWLGNTMFAEDFLFTPGAVMDIKTGAWFSIGGPPGNREAPLFVYDRST